MDRYLLTQVPIAGQTKFSSRADVNGCHQINNFYKVRLVTCQGLQTDNVLAKIMTLVGEDSVEPRDYSLTPRTHCTHHITLHPQITIHLYLCRKEPKIAQIKNKKFNNQQPILGTSVELIHKKAYISELRSLKTHNIFQF